MSTDRDPGRFEHQACLYGDEEEFLAMAVPFVDEGLAAGEPVLAAVAPGNAASVRAILAAGFSPIGSVQLVRPSR